MNKPQKKQLPKLPSETMIRKVVYADYNTNGLPKKLVSLLNEFPFELVDQIEIEFVKGYYYDGEDYCYDQLIFYIPTEEININFKKEMKDYNLICAKIEKEYQDNLIKYNHWLKQELESIKSATTK